MPQYVITVKLGTNDLSLVGKDSQTNQTFSATLAPKEVWKRVLKELEKSPEVEIKWE